MKDYFKAVIGLALIIAIAHSCTQDKQQPSNTGKIIVVPKNSSSQTVVPPEPTIDIDYESRAEQSRREEQEYYKRLMVNDATYQKVRDLRNRYNAFFANGDASAQTRGTSLSNQEASFIDQQMRSIYDYLNAYTSNYEKGDADACLNAALSLAGVVTPSSGLNRGFLYGVKVARNMPEGYQAGVDFTQYSHIFDGNGNLILNNGNRVCLIGCSDPLITSEIPGREAVEYLEANLDWLSHVPSILISTYRPIQNTAGNDGICYFWNETSTEKACSHEWSVVRQEGSSIYGFNPNVTSVFPSPEGYYYAGNNGEVYGYLDSVNSGRVDRIYEVQDAMITHAGNVFSLDSIIRNMASTTAAKQYIYG